MLDKNSEPVAGLLRHRRKLRDQMRPLEEELGKIDEALRVLGFTEDGMADDAAEPDEPDKVGRPRSSTGREPFTPKYSEPARVAARRVLEVTPQGLALSELKEALDVQGREYTKEALRAMLKKEIAKGEIEKRSAPPKSPFQFKYVVAAK